jgi:hypothetical protein
MVLAALTRGGAIVVGALSLVMVHGATAQESRAGGYTFSLKEEAGRCVVTFTGAQHSGRLTMAPEPPCEFVRDESGALKSFKYDDVGMAAVVIVTGNPITDEDRRTWKASAGLFCGKAAQALLARPEGVLVSEEVMRGGIVCATSGVDEHRFYQFAHPMKPMKPKKPAPARK